MSGKPYRKNKPDQFRRIHRELEKAVRMKAPITLTILENPPVSLINRREDELIRERGTLNGPVIEEATGTAADIVKPPERTPTARTI